MLSRAISAVGLVLCAIHSDTLRHSRLLTPTFNGEPFRSRLIAWDKLRVFTMMRPPPTDSYVSSQDADWPIQARFWLEWGISIAARSLPGVGIARKALRHELRV